MSDSSEVTWVRELIEQMQAESAIIIDADVEIDPYTGLEFWFSGEYDESLFPRLLLHVEPDHPDPGDLCAMCDVAVAMWIGTRAIQAELEGFEVPPPGTPYDGPRWPWLTGMR